MFLLRKLVQRKVEGLAVIIIKCFIKKFFSLHVVHLISCITIKGYHFIPYTLLSHNKSDIHGICDNNISNKKYEKLRNYLFLGSSMYKRVAKLILLKQGP